MNTTLIFYKKTLSIAILALFLSACKKSDSSNIVFTKESIPERLVLSGKKHYYPEILRPNNLLVKNNFIVIEDRTNDPPMHILDKTTLRYLNPKGETGFGPGEITAAFMFDFGNSDSTYWVYSLIGKTYTEFELGNNSTQPIQQIKQNETYVTAINMVWASDSSVMTKMASDPAQYVEFDLEEERINEFGKWKEIAPKELFKGLSDFNIGDLHQGKLMRKPKSDIFVHVGIKRDRIEILNKKTGEIIAVDGPLNRVPGFSIVGKDSGSGLIIDEEEPYAYANAYLGKKYIYGLFCGRTRLELSKSEIISLIVYVLDYDGKVKYELVLDQSLQAIAVDENQGKLYGITTDEDPGLVVFNLPDNF